MKSLALVYDKLAQSMTLNRAIFIFALGMVFLCSGLFSDFDKFARAKDTEWLWMALFFLFLGLLFVIHGVLSIHAVARLLVARSRS